MGDKNYKMAAKAEKIADERSERDLIALKEAVSTANLLFVQWMQSIEKMALASIEAEKQMLQSVLKAAEDVDAENFAPLVSGQKEVALASIAANKEVALASVENGKRALRMLEKVATTTIQTGGKILPARFAVMETSAHAELLRAQTEAKVADLREQELEVKRVNAETEARKARAASVNREREAK